MASDYTWLLNGVDLDQVTLGLAAVTLWRPPISNRRSTVVVPGRHGVIGSGLPIFEEPSMTIGLRTMQASQSALETAVNAVAALVGQPKLTLTRVSGGISMSATAELVSSDMDSGFLPRSMSTPTAVLALPGVFFSESPATSPLMSWNAAAAGQPVAHLAGSSAPIRGAVFRATGPCTSAGWTCANSGTSIWATTPVAAGSYLYVRPDDLRAWVSSSASQWTPGGTDVSGAVDYPPAGPLQPWPKVESLTSVRVLLASSCVGASPGWVVRAGRSFL